MKALRRIVIWLGSLLVAAIVFSLIFTGLNSGAGFFRAETVVLVYRFTMTLAFPVWFLYLPLVIAFRDAEGLRSWTMLLVGMLIGPASLAIWGLLLQPRGGVSQTLWHGDPIAFGLLGGMICAFIVGFLTTSFYVIVLKVLYHRSTTAKG